MPNMPEREIQNQQTPPAGKPAMPECEGPVCKPRITRHENHWHIRLRESTFYAANWREAIGVLAELYRRGIA